MATAAAAVVAKARRDAISHFMQANAVNADAAVRWVPTRPVQRRVLRRLVDRGVLVQTGRETYYLDLPAYDDWHRTVRKRAAVAVASLTVIGALAALLA